MEKELPGWGAAPFAKRNKSPAKRAENRALALEANKGHLGFISSAEGGGESWSWWCNPMGTKRTWSLASGQDTSCPGTRQEDAPIPPQPTWGMPGYHEKRTEH